MKSIGFANVFGDPGPHFLTRPLPGYDLPLIYGHVRFLHAPVDMRTGGLPPSLMATRSFLELP